MFETIHRVTKLKETSIAKSRNSKERKNSFRLNNFPYLIYLGQRSRTVSNRLPLVMGRMEFAFKVEFPTYPPTYPPSILNCVTIVHNGLEIWIKILALSHIGTIARGPS